MLRTLLLIFTGLILVSSVSATNVTLESLNPLSQDTVIVGAGDTVRVTSNWHASPSDTTCMVMFVAEGGVLEFTGSSRANFGALWLGDQAGAPFYSTGGGQLIMGANDTLGLWNTNKLGADDFRFRGANCRIDIDGGSSSTRAVIMGMSASSRPHIYGRETDGVFNARFAKFYRLGSSTATPGLTLGRSGYLRTSAQQRVENSIFDSATVCFYGSYASVLTSCSVYVTRDWSYSGLYLYGEGDSVVNSLISHDNRFSTSAHGSSYMLVRVYAPYTVLHTTTIENVNGNGESGRAEYGVRLYADYVSMIGTTIDGFIWGLNSNGSRHDILLDGCTIKYCSHEGILRIENNLDYDWTIQRSLFYGNGHERNSGYSDVLLNIGPSDPIDLGYKFLYNTFCSRDAGDIPLAFRNHVGGSLSTSGYEIVGNIFIGYSTDIRIANYGGGGSSTHVTCDEFKYNAYDNMVIESGCSFAIAGNAYNWADSNLSNQSQYGFVDSAAFDFRLQANSPMIGAGESVYGAQLFGGVGPFDIGYWQTGSSVNLAPQLGLLSDTTINEGQTLSLGVTATDPNGSIPSLSALNIPTNASFTNHGNGNGTFVFASDYDQAGNYSVTFVADDGSLADSLTVVISVSDYQPNQAPTWLTLLNDTSLAESGSLSIGVAASDPDGTIPSLSALGLPANGTFTDNGDGTGLFVFDPVAGQAGDYDVSLVADDGDMSDTISMRVTVVDTEPPGTIIDLGDPDPSGSSIKLYWTAPGDDGYIGSADQYDLRYATFAITDSNFALASLVNNLPAPAVAGNRDSMLLSGLESMTNYYLAIKSADEAANWSALSNVPMIPTLPVADADSILELAFDSLRNDFAGELDSLEIRLITGARYMADSIIIAVSTESPPDSAGSERYALAYAGPGSATHWPVIECVEPDSAFLSAWIKFQDGSFSTRLARALFFWDPVADVEDYPASNLPASLVLGQNYPNPFNPVTTIKYEVASRDRVGLVVLNSLGQAVATLVSGWRSPGKYSVSWDGIDDDHQPVATGVYFYRLQAGDITRMRKMILLR